MSIIKALLRECLRELCRKLYDEKKFSVRGLHNCWSLDNEHCFYISLGLSFTAKSAVDRSTANEVSDSFSAKLLNKTISLDKKIMSKLRVYVYEKLIVIFLIVQPSTLEGIRGSAVNSSISRGTKSTDKEKKIGHRRVGEDGEITYKKIQTSTIMGSIQLGIQHTVSDLHD